MLPTTSKILFLSKIMPKFYFLFCIVLHTCKTWKKTQIWITILLLYDSLLKQKNNKKNGKKNIACKLKHCITQINKKIDTATLLRLNIGRKIKTRNKSVTKKNLVHVHFYSNCIVVMHTKGISTQNSFLSFFVYAIKLFCLNFFCMAFLILNSTLDLVRLFMS